MFLIQFEMSLNSANYLHFSFWEFLKDFEKHLKFIVTVFWAWAYKILLKIDKWPSKDQKEKDQKEKDQKEKDQKEKNQKEKDQKEKDQKEKDEMYFRKSKFMKCKNENALNNEMIEVVSDLDSIVVSVRDFCLFDFNALY
jgi:uncharacterized protein YlxW (UPF0749 family)